MAERRRDGACPYCGMQGQWAGSEERQPGQTAQLCGVCSGWSVKHRNGTSFPTNDPSDSQAAPVFRTQMT